MKKYNFSKIEKKWQKHWEKEKIFEAEDHSQKPKKYILVEFPYPSGAGLHVGHVRSYTALDIISRKLRMQGFNVLYPIGWDAFGLPTEDYAIKNKILPQEATEKNIVVFKKQLKSLGISYDWSREIDTTDPDYYKWTQWIFLKLLEHKLAYKKKMPINWCLSCKIGLANEEVVNGHCERCGGEVEKREKEQWMLAITKYADRLLEDLETVDYLEKIKTQQKNWIGKSEGTLIKFKIKLNNLKKSTSKENHLEVFTTRVDTIFGCTYCVLAPENDLIATYQSQIENRKEVENYINISKKKSDLERSELEKNKTGVEIEGIKVINSLNQKELPIFVADYVLGHYGTGAVMAVPAHDERDREFAKKYNLLIKEVIIPKVTDKKNSPQENKQTIFRQAVQVILINPKNNQVLCLKWKKFPWTTFITGGVKDGEDIINAAKREVLEETGYKNIKYIKTLGGPVESHFYAAHKGVNRKAWFHALVFELLNEEKNELSEKEANIHSLEWMSWKEISKDKNFTCAEYDIWLDRFFNPEHAFIEDGVLINSGEYNQLESFEAREKITNWLEKNNLGKKQVNYKLRDWVFSRQRYWGEPIPVIFCENCGTVPMPEKDLPVTLPKVESYEPTDTGESPLAKINDWVKTKCPKCGDEAKRETDTMPNWAGSSWYFLRYIDPQNKKQLADPQKLKHWMPIDLYNGGMEHTTLHLLYSRFWNKFLFDIGVSPVNEPYAVRRSHGMVLAEDGKKMSKSLGNVINPDDIANEFGVDALRMYEMFMGPFSEAIPWNIQGLIGMKRFLERVWKITQKIIQEKENLQDISQKSKLIHKTIKEVTEDIEKMHFNTALSKLMIWFNGIDGKPDWRGKLNKKNQLEKKIVDFWALEKFLILFSSFASHITEEIWENLGYGRSITLEKWPEFDPKMIEEEEFDLVIQINGKIRDKIKVSIDISQEEAEKLAQESEKIKKFIENRPIRKIIFVKNKLINLVV